ncbi:MAG: hypothetical protein ACMXX6_00405 [Candidatus Woesearchaeota archaeon]
MADILDILIVAGGAYYLANKVGNDESFDRLLIGAAVGVPAALKGPEAYEAVKNYASTDSNKDKLLSSAVLGTVGYVLGDKIGGNVRNAK